MSRAHLFPGLALMSAVFALSCLGDQLVAPDGDLPPLLAVDRPAVQLFRFARGRGVAADTVRITNNGEGTLGLVERVGGVDYITTSRTGWLRTTIVNVGANEAFLVLEPTYAEEEQDEADVAEVVLKARGTPELKRVRVIARTLRGARFEFSVSPLTFAAVPGDPELTQSLTVRNGGNGTLRIRPPAVHHGGGVDGWLSLTNVKGGETAPEYQIEADPSGLGGGLYEAFLVFESLPTEETRARSDSVSVQLNIGQPALGLSTSSLSFTGIRGGAAPPPQNVALANSGEGGFTALGALQVGAVVYQPGAAGWLDVTQEGALVRATASIAGLEKGEYEAAFVVTSENGGSGTLQIFLSIETPVLTPSKSTVSFGLKEGDTLPPPPQRIPLSNTGAGTLASLGQISLGTPVPAVSWLTAGLVGSEVLLTPTGPSLALGAGDYSTQLPVHSVNGGSNTLSVTLSVARGRDPPKLTLSAADVEFRGVAGDPSPSPQDIQLTNAGGGTLGTISLGSVTYEGQGGWLSATLSATTVTLAATTGSLPAGSHRATVPVSSAQGGSAAIQVILTLGSPVLTASSTSAAFSAQEGGGNPANQTITLSNTGPGTTTSLGAISVGSAQYSGPGGWLSTSPSGYTLTLSVTTGTLPTATYQATIPVNSARGGSVSVKVTFTVTRPPDVPDLVASPLTVRMDAVTAGADPADQDVLLSNGGGGSLGTLAVSGVAYAGAASGWLSASLVGSTVTLSASTGSLGPGTHSATVNLASANGGTESVAVTFVVRAPILTLSSGSVAFSGEVGGTASPASVTVNLSNTGAGNFSSLGTVTLGSTSYGGTGGWLNASLGAGGTQVNLGATLGTLAAGSYTASVPVNSAVGGNASIGVSFTVAPSPADPVLSLSSTSAAFFSEEGGGDPSSQAVTLSNSGGGDLPDLGALSLGTVSYAGTSGWLTASLTGRTVTLQPSTGTLTAGSYTATVPVQSASGGARTVAVSFSVSEAADPTDLAVSPSTVRFDAVAGGSNPPGQDVRLYNAGGGDLGAQSLVGITYGSGSGWLAASLASSTLGLSVNLSGLAAGTFNASVEVGSANGGNESVAVTLVVAGPALTLSSRNVSFSAEEGGTASPASISVNLSNTGAGDFSALGAITLGATSYGGAGGWLTKALAGGSTRVDLSASPAGLGPGTYTATVPVNSAYGGSGSISVLAYVSRAADAPALALSASSVGFTALLGGASPAPKTINLSNSGGGTLASLGTLGIGSITYGTGSPGWLSSSALSGGTLTLSPATGSLGNGIHTANVSVTSQNGGNQAVTVTVEVGEPVLTASTLGLAFSGKPGGPPPGTQTVTFSNTGAGGLLDLGPTTVSSINYGAGGSGWLRNPSVGEAVVGGSLEFSVDQAVLPAGSYTSTALISSQNGGSQSITLTLTSVRETDPPRMVLSATAQRFDALVGGANPEAQQVVASNAGGGALGTLTLGPPVYGGGATGWLSADVNQNTVTTRTLTGSLSKGTYTATVPVSSNGGEATIAVTFVVGTSRLTVSPRTVSLGDTVGGGGPDPVTVGISNTGGGTFGSLGAVSLHPTLYEGSAGDWLAATLLAADSVRIRASTGNLPAAPKSYRARVPVVSALGGRDTVVVSFTVAPGTSPPRLSLSLDSMTFAGIWGGAIPPAQTLEASNSGGGELGALSIGDVAYREGTEGWVDASVSDRSITFQAMVDALPPGTHRATVPILSAHGGESSLEVAVVLSQPSLRLSTRTVTFSDTVASPDTLRAQVFISNTGAGNRASLGPITLGTIDHPPGTPRWLATIPDPQGVVEGFLVAFEASASGLQEGSWQARVPVLSRWGGGDTVAVMLSVREPDRSFDLPTIEFVKDTLVDGVTVRRSLVGDSLTVGPLAGGSAVRIGVRNGSKTRVALSGLRVGIPSYADAQPGGWITGAFLSRTTATFDEPAELIVVLDPAGLPPGRYEGRLVISSETPALEQVSPKVLRVVLVLG